MKYKELLFIIAALCVTGMPVTANGKTYPAFGPITTRNQNPFYLQTLNLTPTRATVLPRDVLELRIDSAYSNIYESEANATNSVIEDMELWRLALHANYSVKDDLQIGLEVPFIQMWGGFLDGFVQAFHNAFGFPNAGRERVPDNQFTFQFGSNGQTIYNVSSQTLNLGDIVFHLKHHLLDEGRANPAVAWFFDLKFPTGQLSRGLGNGGMDVGLGLAIEKSYKRIHGYLNAGYYVSGRHDVIEDFSNQSFVSYAAAVEFTILPTWSVIAQVDSGSPILAHTGMDQWDGVPLDLVIGFRGEEPGLLWGNDLIWQAGFSEDATSGGPSIDFTAFLSLGCRLGTK